MSYPHPMPCLPPGFTLMGALSLDWTVTVRILSSLDFSYWRKCSQSSLRMVELVNFHRHSQYHDGNERMKKGRIQNMDPSGPWTDHFCEPSRWTPSWIRSMNYPCGPPLIFEDRFLPEV